jgi:hypothetical protein
VERGVKVKILVCDDEKERADDAVAAIKRSGAAVEILKPLVSGDLKEQLDRLFKRVEVSLEDPKSYRNSNDLAFDACDLAIVDNNLAHLRITGARLTAESIVGYVRAFTSVPYVVSLNKNPDVDFDLRYLIGDYETRADITLNTDHLSNTALWTKDPSDAENGFAPWYWPEMRTVHERRRRQIAFVRANMGKSVLASLRIPSDMESLDFLSLHAKGSLYPHAELGTGGDLGKPLAEVTFRDIFKTWRRAIPIEKDRTTLVDAADQGNPEFADIVARVVAADLDHWLRRDVVAPESMLVDVPHLLMRMPFLLGAKANDTKRWNAAIKEPRAPFGLDAALYEKHLAPALCEHTTWTPTPCFWWPILKRDEELGKLFLVPGGTEWANAVFCEDQSVFVDRSNAAGSSTTDFAAEFEGSWAHRHVARLSHVRYQPLSRFGILRPS